MPIMGYITMVWQKTSSRPSYVSKYFHKQCIMSNAGITKSISILDWPLSVTKAWFLVLRVYVVKHNVQTFFFGYEWVVCYPQTVSSKHKLSVYISEPQSPFTIIRWNMTFKHNGSIQGYNWNMTFDIRVIISSYTNCLFNLRWEITFFRTKKDKCHVPSYN